MLRCYPIKSSHVGGRAFEKSHHLGRILQSEAVISHYGLADWRFESRGGRSEQQEKEGARPAAGGARKKKEARREEEEGDDEVRR